MTDVKTLRDKLAEVDRQRGIERGAETARSKIRLSERPVVRRGLLAFLARPQSAEWEFTHEETTAVYAALGVVRDNAQRRAAEIEKQIEGGAA